MFGRYSISNSYIQLSHLLSRIPIGYWSIPLPSSATNTSTNPAPFNTGAWPYLLRALNWARKYSVHVILDIHGAPGSQNGYDNSGESTLTPVWALNPANVTRTVDTIRWLTENIGGMIDTIELLNEGAGFRGPDWANTIRQYFSDGYDVVRAVEPAPTDADNRTLAVMIGDAFMGLQFWDGFLAPPQGSNVLIDLHQYQIFSDLELNRSFSDHISFACSTLPPTLSFAESNIWTVVGEWSTALTDCAQWLNGRGTGARWDETWFPQGDPDSFFHGSCIGWTGSWNGSDGGPGFSEDYQNQLRQYWEVQVEIGEAVQGWIYWTWKVCISDFTLFSASLMPFIRPKAPTSGAIRKASKAVGYPRSPQIGNTPICADEYNSLPLLDIMLHLHHHEHYDFDTYIIAGR
jgi:glucan 1,3-beta-glucosidase